MKIKHLQKMNKIVKIAKIIWNHARNYFKKELVIVDEVIETIEEVNNEIKRKEVNKTVEKKRPYKRSDKTIAKKL